MNRSSLVIREATLADAQGVQTLASSVLGAHGPLSAGAKLMVDPPGSSTPDFTAVVASDEFRTLIAVDSTTDEIAGVAVVAEDSFSALIGRPAVHVHYLLVTGDSRHRGLGRELLCEITRFAEEIAADNVVVGLWSDARDVNRYFAKVGFIPLVQSRIAPVSTLRRTLGMSRPAAARQSARRRLFGSGSS